MNNKEFEKILNKRIESIKATLSKKGDEYSGNSKDRFYNFKRAAQITGESPEQALWGMALKHLVSVIDIIEKINGKKEYPSDNLLNEKFGDLINYIVLLEAMIKENKVKQN